ncbi:sensor histidine kinase [Cohnella rhizosphaerae]|uniref:Histidine kinase n=1 Tax=Cohnella rhizosphaerae TaxID=1457232 RepID=A0A9X4KXE9_9BACL|nr:hypothetical protein [Cohnella rhizosphaerae]MDG0812642.1 hypothetical protein [Cohnella rhizosphaerae]
MNETQLKEIRDHVYGQRPLAVAGRGIGLRNVHERIKMQFGESYGLRIDSRPGEGTTVELAIPGRQDEEEADERC